MSETKIKQWNNVKLEDGIASLELQLSKEPVLGAYTVAAVVGVSLVSIATCKDKTDSRTASFREKPVTSPSFNNPSLKYNCLPLVR